MGESSAGRPVGGSPKAAERLEQYTAEKKKKKEFISLIVYAHGSVLLHLVSIRIHQTFCFSPIKRRKKHSGIWLYAYVVC